MKNQGLAVVVALGLGIAAVHAETLLYTFAPTNGVSGSVGSSSLTITKPSSTGNFSITAYGFNADGTTHTLYQKNAGTDEQGLGLTSTLDNELTLTSNGSQIANFIQIDVSQVYKTFSAGLLEMESVTGGESFDVFGSNTKGTTGTKLISGSTLDQVFFTIPSWGNYEYISVAVHPVPVAAGYCNSHACDNVLLNALEVTRPDHFIPEPGTSTLVAGGLSLLALFRRRTSRRS